MENVEADVDMVVDALEPVEVFISCILLRYHRLENIIVLFMRVTN